MTVLSNKPQIEVQTAPWDGLAPHAKRGALFVVAPSLNLATVGAKISEDDSSVVSAWVAEGLLYKPSPEMVSQWQDQQDAEFAFVIVQPYVLCQKTQVVN